MDESTVRALTEWNRAFYDGAAAEWSATRAAPWPGWYPIARALAARARRVQTGAALRVLDAGCGNGRFGRFLAGEIDAPICYVGLDLSHALLDEARRALGGAGSGDAPAGRLRARLLRCDLARDGFEAALGPARFDLVAAFGVLHHVPGRGRRRALVSALARRVAPGGLLVYTLWRFAECARLRARRVAWSHGPPVDRAQLEPGDVLLRWGAEGGRARYCHDVDAAEARALEAVASLPRLGAYRADGCGAPRADGRGAPRADGRGGNVYVLFRRP